MSIRGAGLIGGIIGILLALAFSAAAATVSDEFGLGHANLLSVGLLLCPGFTLDAWLIGPGIPVLSAFGAHLINGAIYAALFMLFMSWSALRRRWALATTLSLATAPIVTLLSAGALLLVRS